MYEYATFHLGASEEANHANQELASSGELYGVEVKSAPRRART